MDVTTVVQVKRELREWQLGRCVFLGNAGIVSAENLRELARGGGREPPGQGSGGGRGRLCLLQEVARILGAIFSTV